MGAWMSSGMESQLTRSTRGDSLCGVWGEGESILEMTPRCNRGKITGGLLGRLMVDAWVYFPDK